MNSTSYDKGGPRTTVAKSLSYFFWRLIWDVLRLTFSILRYPLALLLVGWLICWALSAFATMMLDTLKPVCDIPIVSVFCGDLGHSLDIGQVKPSGAEIVLRPDFPALAKIQGASLGDLMTSSIEGSHLSLDIKLAQLATSDLIALVKFSKLSTRNAIADALETFVEDAKATSRSLQKLNARVNGAVDQ